MPATSPWVERLSRVGIVAKAVVYLLIGSLATGVALEVGGRLTGSRGVLYFLDHQPLGRALLGLLALGLAAYTFWLFVQALVDPDAKGTSFIGLIDRAGQIITGLAHGALTLEAVRLTLGLPGLAGDGVQEWIGRLLRQPHGIWIVGAAGAVVMLLGAIQIGRALLGDVRRAWRLGELDPERDRGKILLGRFGLAARGLVLAVSGGLVVRAARAFDPDAAGGIAEALQAVRDEAPFDWLLGLVALGLVSYGLFALIEARYRFIPSG
jgi:hypothetical protein